MTFIKINATASIFEIRQYCWVIINLKCPRNPATVYHYTPWARVGQGCQGY